ncbi:MAG: sulfotransferase domain-containing protein [Phycisphaera sp.]|nr:MAG: sulfotransferase domain-containing protein [Phycisphaera sp.]
MLPTFLIIGAQKSGTTTLYRDLLTQPGVYFPFHKEPTALAHDKVLTPEGLAEYESLFANAKATDARGDASTGYAKIPRFTNVPERAHKVLGPDITLLYILREPVSRIVSHHHHEITNKPGPATVDEFIDADHTAIPFSRYAFQAKAWLEYYPVGRLNVLLLEEYVKDRRAAIQLLAPKLGFASEPDRVDPQSKFNTARGRSSDRGLAMRIRRTRPYQRLRPMLPVATRDRLRRMLTPKAPPPPPPPSEACVDRLLGELEDDQRELADILGRPYPLWDPDGVRDRYEKLRLASQ